MGDGRVLETLHTVLCIVMVYAYTVSHFGDFDFLGKIYWYVRPTESHHIHKLIVCAGLIGEQE